MPHRKYKSNTNKRKTKKANQKQSKIFKIKIKKHRRKISFRKNKNNNLRTKSLKKIGGAHGDKAEDFGLEKGSMNAKQLSDLKELCDSTKYTPDNPYGIFYNIHRNQRIACLTYYIKGITWLTKISVILSL